MLAAELGHLLQVLVSRRRARRVVGVVDPEYPLMFCGSSSSTLSKKPSSNFQLDGHGFPAGEAGCPARRRGSRAYRRRRRAARARGAGRPEERGRSPPSSPSPAGPRSRGRARRRGAAPSSRRTPRASSSCLCARVPAHLGNALYEGPSDLRVRRLARVAGAEVEELDAPLSNLPPAFVEAQQGVGAPLREAGVQQEGREGVRPSLLRALHGLVARGFGTEYIPPTLACRARNIARPTGYEAGKGGRRFGRLSLRGGRTPLRGRAALRDSRGRRGRRSTSTATPPWRGRTGSWTRRFRAWITWSATRSRRTGTSPSCGPSRPSGRGPTSSPAVSSTGRCGPGSTRRRSSSPGSGRPRESSCRALGSAYCSSTSSRPRSWSTSTASAPASASGPAWRLRVNPDVDAGTHEHVATGRGRDKFGIPVDEALALAERVGNYRCVDLIGVHQHIGSQITKLAPYTESVERSRQPGRRAQGPRLRHQLLQHRRRPRHPLQGRRDPDPERARRRHPAHARGDGDEDPVRDGPLHRRRRRRPPDPRHLPQEERREETSSSPTPG